MDTDKVKIYGSKVKVDSVAKVAEIEQAEKQKMLDKARTGQNLSQCGSYFQ
jgi:T-complex protein 1 subunit beta